MFRVVRPGGFCCRGITRHNNHHISISLFIRDTMRGRRQCAYTEKLQIQDLAFRFAGFSHSLSPACGLRFVSARCCCCCSVVVARLWRRFDDAPCPPDVARMGHLVSGYLYDEMVQCACSAHLNILVYTHAMHANVPANCAGEEAGSAEKAAHNLRTRRRALMLCVSILHATQVRIHKHTHTHTTT